MSGKGKLQGSIVTGLLIALILMAGCGPVREANLNADVVKADGNEVKIQATDNGSQVSLAQGQILVVTLESNPTTGYSWQADGLAGDVLQQVGEAEFQAQSDLLGAPGVEILRFQATGSGQVELKLVYHRPWEQGVAPLQTFSVQVTVR
jgi:inhibitor of cysteine peptidase